MKKRTFSSLKPVSVPNRLTVLVLAPHPDDFDSIGITLKHLHNKKAQIHLHILFSGFDGVEDDFCTPSTPEEKTETRIREQKKSCTFWGLPGNSILFFNLKETPDGGPEAEKDAFDLLFHHMEDLKPDLLFLPHGNDTNRGHRWTWSLFQAVSSRLSHPACAFLFRDPKTIAMRDDILTFFGEEEAQWKGRLLRFHRSQHTRNLNTRHHGFDERILKVNRETAARYDSQKPYAEAFELQFAGPEKKRNRFYCSFHS